MAYSPLKTFLKSIQQSENGNETSQYLKNYHFTKLVCMDIKNPMGKIPFKPQEFINKYVFN